MLINYSVNSNKTNILVNSYARLLNEGVSADKILVLVQNFKKKDEFIQKTKSLLKIDALTKFNVYTFFGLVYNSILENWCTVEEKISSPGAKISPNMCGLEVSQYIFKNAINEVQFKGYNSKGNLLHQLLRRYSLGVLNALTQDEIKERAKILPDPFYSDIQKALNLYKKKTLDFRAFDYLRQADIFKFVYQNTKNPYEYVILDDGDEITPALFEYLKHIKPDIKEFFIAYDKFGCTRKGFLGALEFDFESFTGEKAQTSTPDEKHQKALEIFNSVKTDTAFELPNIKMESFVYENEMVEDVVNKINALLSSPEKRVKPKDIAIVTPNTDNYLKILLEKIKAPLNFLSGSEKLSKNPKIAAFLEILNLINNKNLKISTYSLRGVLAGTLNLEFKLALKIADDYEVSGEEIFTLLEKYKDHGEIEEFLTLKEEIENEKFSKQLFELAQKYIPLTPENEDLVYKINQLLKQIRDFEDVFGTTVSNRELLNQIENTIVSENPITGQNALNDAITVATAQKLIDNSINSKYTFLLDTTSSNWTKQDIGPLYNAWVFQKSWQKPSFELQDNINCALDKTARILRKIYLLNSGEIYVYSSIYDFLGVENFKGINHFFKAPASPETETPEPRKEFKIIPRPDQKPVLDYEQGKMAVSAVAGAGKTTIMLALILKLLNQKIPPENIFVLTFMDSAARNFKERIKENFPNLVELPHISTIHGLALRILRENNNHTKVNLDVDFEILDEVKRSGIIKDIICQIGLDPRKSELYERGISAWKNQKHPNKDKMTPLFKRVFEEYKAALISGNLIDYDDLLALSLALLRQNKSIREYYQNLMKFIIEDEAQDSSEIQQELIKILSEKHGNLIRTGDVNQAITTTFSNADVKGFKRFIAENPCVKMNYSNRNATGVIDFANTLIKYGEKAAPEAFLPVETKPVEGKNIVDSKSVSSEIFETEKDERAFISDKINTINAQTPNASIGVLLRSNRAVAEWSAYLKETTNLKIETNSDTLSLNPVFKAVLAVLNFLNNPLSNKEVENFAKTLMALGFYKDDFEIFGFLKEHNTPFILGENEYFTLFWDLKYFLTLWNLPPFEITYRAGEIYFNTNKAHKANIAMVSGIVSKVQAQNKTFEDTLERLNQMAERPNKTGIKLINDLAEKENGTIQILTLHKSKGDEFDYVFIPELTEDNLPLSLSAIKIKENSKFIEAVKTEPKTEDELKKETLDENYRLMYVGLTRAKKKLYLSSAKEYKVYNKPKSKKESLIFEIEKEGKCTK